MRPSVDTRMRGYVLVHSVSVPVGGCVLSGAHMYVPCAEWRLCLNRRCLYCLGKLIYRLSVVLVLFQDADPLCH